jgi:hypothetical protein
MAGRAVATMVWSTTARNIGSMMEGKTLKNRPELSGAGGMASLRGQRCGQDSVSTRC